MTPEPENETTARKIGRPIGAKTRGKRRNYSEELTDLQSRVDTAVRLLTRSLANAEGTPRELVQVAIETLQGDA